MKSKQAFAGKLNFETDAWTSPNGHALVAFTVHYADEGKIHGFLLDIIEVGKVSFNKCSPVIYVAARC